MRGRGTQSVEERKLCLRELFNNAVAKRDAAAPGSHTFEYWRDYALIVDGIRKSLSMDFNGKYP